MAIDKSLRESVVRIAFSFEVYSGGTLLSNCTLDGIVAIFRSGQNGIRRTKTKRVLVHSDEHKVEELASVSYVPELFLLRW